MNIKSTGYGEDTGWIVRYRLSTLNFGPHKRSLNTNTGVVLGSSHSNLSADPENSYSNSYSGFIIDT
jgi:hypothetical protein